VVPQKHKSEGPLGEKKATDGDILTDDAWGGEEKHRGAR